MASHGTHGKAEVKDIGKIVAMNKVDIEEEGKEDMEEIETMDIDEIEMVDKGRIGQDLPPEDKVDNKKDGEVKGTGIGKNLQAAGKPGGMDNKG